tara:strand:- start:148 stop:420 length:273 start_codon:yes stop_codon:yes gene_type:complete
MGFPEQLKRYLDPITAIVIICFFVFAVHSIFEDRELKKEISLQCGWAEENYECICEKSEVIALNNRFILEGKGSLLKEDHNSNESFKLDR